MFSSHLFRAPLGVSFFLLLALQFIFTPAFSQEEIVHQRVNGGDFRSVHEALVEVIEAEGLVVGQILPFSNMLERTGANEQGEIYRQAEIIQFCSASLAHRMALEDPEQIVFCPLSIAVYVKAAEPEGVVIAYRALGSRSPARAQADALMARLARRAAQLGKLRW